MTKRSNEPKKRATKKPNKNNNRRREEFEPEFSKQKSKKTIQR